MKRYDIRVFDAQDGTGPGWALQPNVNGQFIRHDDPDLAALVEAAEANHAAALILANRFFSDVEARERALAILNDHAKGQA